MSAEPKYVAETLAWCNARRAERGLEALDRLPKGQQGRADSCPCGSATGLLVYEEHYSHPNIKDAWVAERGHPVPRAVGRFVRAFDEGRLPQYVEGNS